MITGRFDGGGEECFLDLRYGYTNCFIYLKTRDANKSSRIPAVIMNLRGLWGGDWGQFKEILFQYFDINGSD
jgi:hypothetical protein